MKTTSKQLKFLLKSPFSMRKRDRERYSKLLKEMDPAERRALSISLSAKKYAQLTDEEFEIFLTLAYRIASGEFPSKSAYIEDEEHHNWPVWDRDGERDGLGWAGAFLSNNWKHVAPEDCQKWK